VRCYDCHSVMPTRLRMERLAEGSSSWTEQQSRQNFVVVSQLVAPAEPLKSRLLLHPLSPEAGGDPTHAGGQILDFAGRSRVAPHCRLGQQRIGHRALHFGHGKNPGSELRFFQAKVQPIFLKPRPGHARCYSCHNQPGRPFLSRALVCGEFQLDRRAVFAQLPECTTGSGSR